MLKFLLILGTIAISANFIAADDVRQRFDAYPAAGYRPNRRFNLPNEPQSDNNNNNNEEIPQQIQPRRPDLTYGIPPAARYRLVDQQQQSQPEQQYFFEPRRSQPARLTASKSLKSAQLAVNSEARPDDEPDAEIATDIEVQNKVGNEGRNNVPQQPPTAVQPSTVYYPAGAVSFVQPLPGSFAQPVAQPAAVEAPVLAQSTPLAAAPVVAQPAPAAVVPSAAYLQQLQYAQLQAQPLAAAPFQPNFAQIQAQPVQAIKAARLEAPAAAVSTAPIAFNAAYTAAPYISSAAYLQQLQYAQLQAQPLAAVSSQLQIQPNYANIQAQALAAAAPYQLEFQPNFAQIQAQPVQTTKVARLEAPAAAISSTPITFNTAYTAAPYALAANPVLAASPGKLEIQPAARIESQPAANILTAVPSYASPAAFTAVSAYTPSAALTADPAFFASAVRSYATPSAFTAAPVTAAASKSAEAFVQPQYYVSAPAKLQAW